MSTDEAMLRAAGVFYEAPGAEWSLNMNDTFMWALAYGPEVTPETLPRVAELFRRYGDAGLYYWCVEIGDVSGSEFEDIQRAIEFVRHEEEIRKAVPNSNKRAYHKVSYTLGERK